MVKIWKINSIHSKEKMIIGPPPTNLMIALDKEFHFDYNSCPLYGEFFEDGLVAPWGNRVFINPPYSNPKPWVQRGYHQVALGNSELVVMLLKADTSTILFHEYILPRAHEIRFIKGRLKYGGSNKPAPFPSMIVVFKKK